MMFKSPLVVHQEGHSACRRPAATVFRDSYRRSLQGCY